MKFQITTATRKVSRMSKRIRAVPGGTSGSKTISILMCLIDLAQTDKSITLTSVVSESMPHLRRGAVKDFLMIMESQGYFRENRWNRTSLTYTFETGSKIEFFSVDSGDKLRGARRDRLFINEANNTTFEAFNQLEVRTKDFVFMDWNPSNEFYYYTEIKDIRKDVEEITLTYLDNEALDINIVNAIEQRKANTSWFKVYGLGQLGEVEGKIYKDWKVIDEIPHEARLERRGLDFGYSNDPTAIVDIYKYNGGYILDELLYQKGLSNKQIADFLSDQDQSILTYADSSEPKSIDEIKSYGISIIGANKGPGSVNQGIQFVQDQRMSITRRSVNGRKEYDNYLWKVDRDGKILNVPEDMWNHFLDAVRYGFNGFEIAPIQTKRKKQNVRLTRYG